MDKYICECCGGNINRATMQCDYCGTKYKEEYDKPIRIETFRNPIRTFNAKVRITEEMYRSLPTEEISRFAVNELVRALSQSIAPMMKITEKERNQYFEREIIGTIKMVEPLQDEMGAK